MNVIRMYRASEKYAIRCKISCQIKRVRCRYKASVEIWWPRFVTILSCTGSECVCVCIQKRNSERLLLRIFFSPWYVKGHLIDKHVLLTKAYVSNLTLRVLFFSSSGRIQCEQQWDYVGRHSQTVQRTASNGDFINGGHSGRIHYPAFARRSYYLQRP